MKSDGTVSYLSGPAVAKLVKEKRLTSLQQQKMFDAATAFITEFSSRKTSKNDYRISEWSYTGKPDEPVAWIWFYTHDFLGDSENRVGLYFLIGVDSQKVHYFFHNVLEGNIHENSLQGFSEETA